jgi:hypothetical protein
MVILAEQNNKGIKTAQERIEKLDLEDIGENLYNASLGNYMWRGKYEYSTSHYPFYISHRGTHADYEIIVPNVNEVYNVSDENVKKKMVDSVAWLIDNCGKEMRVEWDYQKDKQDYQKIEMHHISGWLLRSFTGNEAYPLDLHEFEKSPYLLKEDSPEMREYIKNKFRSSLLNKINGKEDNFKKEIYGNVRPMEILPLDVWKSGISNRYALDILINSRMNDKSSFFGEKEYSFTIDEFVELGLKDKDIERFFQSGNMIHQLYFEHFLKMFGEIGNENVKKSFMEVLDNAIDKSEYYVRKGDKVEFEDKNKKK